MEIPVTDDRIIVFDRDGRAIVYPHISSAEGWLESIDTEDGEYPIAFTMSGQVIEVTTGPSGEPRLRVLTDTRVEELVGRLIRSPPVTITDL